MLTKVGDLKCPKCGEGFWDIDPEMPLHNGSRPHFQITAFKGHCNTGHVVEAWVKDWAVRWSVVHESEPMKPKPPPPPPPEPKTLVCFDPGIRVAGLAIFVDKKLTWAGIVRNSEQTERGPYAWIRMADAVNEQLQDISADRIVVEVPQVYRQSSWKGDPADLIELAGVNGAVVASVMAGSHRGYLPREWKKQVRKDVMLRRIMSRLSPEEQAAFDDSVPESLKHNAIDAAGLGLFELGRLS